MGKNATESIFTRFPGFRLTAPLPDGNGYAALSIGARLIGKNAHSPSFSAKHPCHSRAVGELVEPR
ncbi:MAG TPA: hypothetical protein DCP61_06965, partial [Treponema sp.]|nr:hypothetical protein [Treponema sp.]